MNRVEIGSAIATGVLYLLVSVHLEWHVPFLVGALLFWTAFTVARARRDPGALSRWGFTTAKLRPAFLAATAVALAGGACLAAFGDGLPLDGHFVLLMLLYPLWGWTQQFLVQALVVRNLAELRGPISSSWLLTVLGALLFAAMHVPDWELCGATLLLGLCFTPIYLRWRNLWPLGLYHGWLGALFYYCALGRDPWAELFSP